MNAPLWLAVLLTYLCASVAAFPTVLEPSDTRSWEQVTADFISHEVTHANYGGEDGRRLKELGPKRAVAFLMPFLARDQPFGLRIKAIGALGKSAFQEALPSLAAIAKDETESEAIRAQSLNPGLRYMKSPKAVATAISLSTHKSDYIRNSAYWVLSEHGSNNAIDTLASRLRADDKPLLGQIICALYYSKHPRAGRIVFDLVDFSALHHDEDLLMHYAAAMEQYRIPEAQEHMLTLAQQPGNTLSGYYALRYFASFPREEIVSPLIARIDAQSSGDLYESVTQFIRSSRISAESQKKLSEYIANGKVRKPSRFPFEPIDVPR